MPIQPQFATRFQFIGHALRGDGPFRPAVSTRLETNGSESATLTSSQTALVAYPREGSAKFARRNQVAFYASPLARACARYCGFLSSRSPQRELPGPLYKLVADDVDGKGNSLDVFWSEFAVEAKARGSMLLLVDAPATMAETKSLAQQLAERRAPFWVSIKPEAVTDYQLGDDGKFDSVSFAGTFTQGAGEEVERVDCVWTFTRKGWEARDKDDKVLTSGEHALGECPVIAFTESGDFPCFGPFAAIADIAKRLFNTESELDEILRSQTFSLLTMQVPDNSTTDQKAAAAKAAGESVGTHNLMVHSGSTPAFIAPPDGPATVYLKRIEGLEAKIDAIAMDPSGSAARESGLALQMRFQELNADLARFAGRMEDLERRAWELTSRWLKMTAAPEISWPRDFNIADLAAELKVLTDMQAAGMPKEVIAAQQKRIVALQFTGMDADEMQAIIDAIDERTLERGGEGGEGNVIPLRPDPNAPVREAVIRALGNGGG